MNYKTKGIPIKNYFDLDIYNQEINIFFRGNTEYIGAKSMFEKNITAFPVNRLRNEMILSKTSEDYFLLENVCSHRQARMLNEKTLNSCISCPLHGWSFKSDGQCLSTPFYHCDKNLHSLSKFGLQEWNNLFFYGERNINNDLKSFKYADEMQISSMKYTRTFSEELDFNWKNYIDGFAEDYHVPFVHPGFANFVDLKSIEWIDDSSYTGQLFKLRPKNFLVNHPTTPVYRKWVDELIKYYGNNLPNFGGILIMYYPNVMIEWYPLFMAISTVHPTGPNSCVNHIDFFHHEDVLNNFPSLKTAAEEAYIETANEDAVMSLELSRGRKTLYLRNQNEIGPYQSPYEDGLALFHNYYNSAFEKRS